MTVITVPRGLDGVAVDETRISLPRPFVPLAQRAAASVPGPR